MQKTKRPLSFLLAVMMIVSMFAAVPFTASAAGGVISLTAGSNQSGTGWSWDGSTNTLTLSGATFDDCMWMKVASATLILADGTNNIMHGGLYNTSGGGYWSGICVGTQTPSGEQQNFSSNGTLTIKGSGTLTMSPTTTTHYLEAFAINCNSLTVGTGSDNPVLDFTLQRSYFHSYGIQAYSNFTINSGKINISCGDFVSNGQNWFGCGMFVRKGSVVINNGSVTISVANGNASCYGFRLLNSGTFTMNGGTLDITVTGTFTSRSCISTGGKVTVNAGEMKLRNVSGTNVVSANPLAMGQFTTYTNCTVSGSALDATSAGATCTAVTKKACTITWKNWGGNVLETETVAEGTTLVHYGTPTRDEDAAYTYTFSGWTDSKGTFYARDALPEATGDETFTATFSTTPSPASLVIALIDAIGEVSYTDACKEKIDTARGAYNLLYLYQQNLVSNYATLTAAEETYCDLEGAALTLAIAKSDACDALSNYKNAADYRDAQKTELDYAIVTGKSDINAAATVDEVNAALAAAKAVIDDIPTDAELTAEELDAAKFYAKSELDGYRNPDDYRDAQKTELANAIAAGKTAIDNAESIADVRDALALTKAAIEEIKTDAQLTEEEAAADQEAANAVIDLIDAIDDPVVYTDACKAKIDAAIEAYVALTDTQKVLVSNYEKLIDADYAYDNMDVVLWDGTVPTSAPSGYDETASPITLDTAKEFVWFFNRVGNGANFDGKTVVLTTDIDLGGHDFGIVWTTAGYTFNGTFDGQNHTVSNFTFASSGQPYRWSLFRNVKNATIKNLQFDNVNIGIGYGYGHAVLVGMTQGDVTIENVQVNSGSVSGGIAVAGVVGQNKAADLTIRNCSNAASITATTLNAGGIVGASTNDSNGNTAITVENCTNTGDVTAVGGYASGIYGVIAPTSAKPTVSFKNCANEGALTAFEGTDDICAYCVVSMSITSTESDAVIALIDEIGTVENTAESKAKIEAAREAYNALTDAHKKIVTNYTTLTSAEETYAEEAAAYGQDWQSVTIDDQISINFILDTAKHAGMQSITIHYVNQDKEVTNTTCVDVNDLVPDGNNYKVTAEVAPAQIGDTITITIVEANGDTTDYDTSIAKYCEHLINNYNGNDADAVRALAEATLEYGEAANEYFAYGASFAGTEKAQAAINTVKQEVTPTLSVHANGKVTGVSFVALTKPEFRFYTSLTEEEALELNKKINVTTGNAKAQFVKNAETGEVMLEVTEIKAENMGDEVNITIGDWTITFRGNDFAWLLVQNTETAVLGAALYNYGKAANACFAA